MKLFSILLVGIGILCLTTIESYAIAAGRESPLPIVTECAGHCDDMPVGHKVRHPASRRHR
jgi:hypothetical protein